MKALSLLLIPSAAFLVSACAPEPVRPVYGGPGYGHDYYGHDTVYVQGEDRDHRDYNETDVNRTNVNERTVNRTNVNDVTVNRENVKQTDSHKRKPTHKAEKPEQKPAPQQ